MFEVSVVWSNTSSRAEKMDVNISLESSPSCVNPFSRKKMSEILFSDLTVSRRPRWEGLGSREALCYLGKTHVEEQALEWLAPSTLLSTRTQKSRPYRSKPENH